MNVMQSQTMMPRLEATAFHLASRLLSQTVGGEARTFELSRSDVSNHPRILDGFDQWNAPPVLGFLKQVIYSHVPIIFPEVLSVVTIRCKC